MRWQKIVFGVLLAAMATSAFALRCGNQVISVGDSQLKALRFCGKPELENHSERLVRDEFGKRVIYQDIWTYNFGPRQFLTVITFEEGQVVDIQEGDYGY